MAISSFEKALFVVHQDERRSFLNYLQKKGVVELTELTQKHVVETFPALYREDSTRLNDLVALTSQIDFALTFLKPYETDKTALSFLSPKELQNTDELMRLSEKYNIRGVIDRITQLNREINELTNQIIKIEASAETLEPWLGIKAKVEDLGETKNVYQTLFMIYN